MVAEWDAIGTDVLEAALRPFPPVRAASRLWRRLGTGDTLRLARTLLQPVARMAAERFGGNRGTAAPGRQRPAHRPGTDNAASAAYGWLLAMLGQRIGFPVPAGGSGALTDALVARFTARGGRLDVGRPVTSVLVEGRRAPACSTPTAAGSSPAARCSPTSTHPASTATSSARSTCRRGSSPTRPVPVGLLHRQDRLGTGPPGPVDGAERPVGRHGARRRRRRRAAPLRLRPVGRPAARRTVPAVRPDDHGRPRPVPTRHRVGVGVHPRATRAGVGSRRRPALGRPDGARRRGPRARFHECGPGPVGGRARRPAGLRRQPRRRRDHRRHLRAAPAAGVPPDARDGPRRHPGRPAVPVRGVGATGRRGARRARRERRPGRAGRIGARGAALPGRGPLRASTDPRLSLRAAPVTGLPVRPARAGPGAPGRGRRAGPGSPRCAASTAAPGPARG
ncbi:hypothetical protein L7F22_028030 [Adiantum nelumboides]|nr:hypothetical protein [Adiantum nelumboides]